MQYTHFLFIQSMRAHFCETWARAMWLVANYDTIGDVLIGAMHKGTLSSIFPLYFWSKGIYLRGITLGRGISCTLLYFTSLIVGVIGTPSNNYDDGFIFYCNIDSSIESSFFGRLLLSIIRQLNVTCNEFPYFKI